MDASTNLEDHPTGLGVKGIPCHVIFANPVDVIDTAEDERILFSLKIRLSMKHMIEHKTSKMKMLSRTVRSLCVYAASLLSDINEQKSWGP